MKNLSEFVKGYLVCALWSSTDGNEPLDNKYSVSDISDKTLAEMIGDCEDFQKANKGDLEKAYEKNGYTESSAGHDFWLTRNGHGAGFWDRGLGEVGKVLTAASKVYGPCDLYVGDDGKIYC